MQPAADAYEHITIGFRGYRAHSEFIQRAAKKEGASSAAAFMRKHILEWSAAVLNEPVPEFRSLEGQGDVVAEAAKRHGMSARDYMLKAAREMAAKELAHDAELTANAEAPRPVVLRRRVNR
jgi:uncharacterized protein (DUF1778 family)